MPDITAGGFARNYGVALTPPFEQWCARASAVAKTRGSVAEKSRYESWVVQRVVTLKRSAASLDWSVEPVTMPAPAPAPAAAAKAVAPQWTAAAEKTARSRLVQQALAHLAGVARGDPMRLQRLTGAFWATMRVVDSNVESRRATYATTTPDSVLRDILAADAQAQAPAHAPAVFIQPPVQAQPVPHYVQQHMRHAVPAPAPVTKRARSPSPPVPHAAPRGYASRAVLAGVREFVRELVADDDDGAPRDGWSSRHGTSTALERRYTRAEPQQEDLRGPAVLERAFAHVHRKTERHEVPYAEDEHDELRWLSDQLKGMRQDIKVQRIQSPFAVGVYETHARLCLRVGDILELNQNQAAIRAFHHRGCLSADGDSAIVEFAVYRIVYLAFTGQSDAAAAEARAAVTAHETALTAKALLAAHPTAFPKECATGAAAVAAMPASLSAEAAILSRGGTVRYWRDARGDSMDPSVAVCAKTKGVPAAWHLEHEEGGAPRPGESDLQRLQAVTATLPTREVYRVALALCEALAQDDARSATAALLRLCRDPLVGVGLSRMLAMYLQRLRVRWLFNMRAVRGALRTAVVAKSLGFPALDRAVAAHAEPRPKTAPEYPAGEDGAARLAWDALFATVKVDPVPAYPEGDACTMDGTAVIGSVVEYCKFLNSSSGGPGERR